MLWCQLTHSTLPLCLARSGQIQGMVPGDLLVVPIYAALSPEQQAKVFDPTPPGKRKVCSP